MKKHRTSAGLECVMVAAALLLFSCWLSAQSEPAVPPALAQLQSTYKTGLSSIQSQQKTEAQQLRSDYFGTMVKASVALGQAGERERAAKLSKDGSAVFRGGAPTAEDNPDLAPARKILLEGLATSEQGAQRKLFELDLAYQAHLVTLQAELGRSAQPGDAAAAEPERQRVSAELRALLPILRSAPAGAATSPRDPFAGPSPSTAGPAAPEAEFIVFPGSTPENWPPRAVGMPFEKTAWTEPLTIPGARHRMIESIQVQILRDHSAGLPQIVFETGGYIDANLVPKHAPSDLLIGPSRVLAQGTTFMLLRMHGGAGSITSFEKCQLSNCSLGRKGTGNSGALTKWNFQGCSIMDRLIENFRVSETGLRVTHCTIDRAVLPSVLWSRTESDARIHGDWLLVSRTRFFGCEVPLSFLMITEACSFTRCRFTDDRPALTLTHPLTVQAYMQDCTSAVSQFPANFKIESHPLTEAPQR